MQYTTPAEVEQVKECLAKGMTIPETVLRKAKRIQQDAEEQERIFRQHGYNVLQATAKECA